MKTFKNTGRILLALLLTLCLCTSLCVLFASCGDDPKTPEGGEETPNDKPGEEQKDPEDPGSEEDPFEGQIVIADETGILISLVRGTELQESGTVDCELILRDFITKVGKKLKTEYSGVTVRRDSQSALTEGDKLLFCVTKNYNDAIAKQNETPATAYDISIKDGTVIVAAHGNQFAKEAIDVIVKALTVVNGKVCLPADFADHYDAMPTHNYPKFVTSGVSEGVYNCNDTTFEYSYRNVKESEVTDYYTALTSSGYTLYAQNAIGASTFRTYRSNDATVYVGWHPARSQAKIILAPAHDYVPPVTADAFTSKGITPTLVQLGRKGTEQSAPGMGFLYQLSDGRYILIDGGPMNSEDVQGLYNYLVEHKPSTHEKPVIALWMFSHAHGDHTGLADTFLSNYAKQITLEMIGFNFPDFETLEVKNETMSNATAISLLRRARACNSDVIFWKLHAGQKLTIADAEIEIIFTHEEQYPTATPWGNHTSSAWTITVGGVKTTFLGDCETTLNQFMDDCYGDAMKTDILQVAHHGFNGASPKLYEDHCKPDVCLFACDEDRFQNDPRCIGTQKGFEFNAWVRTNCACYSSTKTTTITFTGAGKYTLKNG